MAAQQARCSCQALQVRQWIPALLNLAAGNTDPGPLASFTSSNKYRFKDAGQKRPGGPVNRMQVATAAEAERAALVG
jgi:hypothetical protein